MDRPLATWSDETPPRYRYTLRRPRLHGTLEPPLGLGSICAFLLLNPSTATETQDDPTIRRCMDFSRRWGYDELLILNVYALRSTDPKSLWLGPDKKPHGIDPVGSFNDAAIIAEARRPGVGAVVCGWGKHARPDRVSRMAALLSGIPAGLQPQPYRIPC